MNVSTRAAISNVHLASDAETFLQQVVPFWKPDIQATECERCFTPFSWRVRIHHCRDCGGVFCSDCTPHRVPLPYRPAHLIAGGSPGDKQRVCSYCWFFIDLHQRQEHDRANEARRMQLRAQDEGFMRRMAENSVGCADQLRNHMNRELLGRNRAALEKRSTRSQAATSTKWSGSDDDGESWAIAFVPNAPALNTKDDSVCYRNNIIEPSKQWANTAKKQTGATTQQLRDVLHTPVAKLPSPSLALFLELSERCGVNLTLDTTTAVGQSVIASTQPSTWHRVTEENLMDEKSLVGVAAYFRT